MLVEYRRDGKRYSILDRALHHCRRPLKCIFVVALGYVLGVLVLLASATVTANPEIADSDEDAIWLYETVLSVALFPARNVAESFAYTRRLGADLLLPIVVTNGVGWGTALWLICRGVDASRRLRGNSDG